MAFMEDCWLGEQYRYVHSMYAGDGGSKSQPGQPNRVTIHSESNKGRHDSLMSLVSRPFSYVRVVFDL